MDYSVSTLAVDISKIDDIGQVLTFPILEADYNEAAALSPGVQVLAYEISDDGSRYNINSEISFDNLESLSSFTGMQYILQNQGNNKLLTIIVYEISEDQGITGQNAALINQNFSEDSFSFKITMPGDIIRVNGATFSGSDVSFKISLDDLIQSTETIRFSVEYR